MSDLKLFQTLLRTYQDSNLEPEKILLLGFNDAAAVSDGTAQCHLKEAMHLKVLNDLRESRKLTLDVLVLMMEDCERWTDHVDDGPVSDAALHKLRYVVDTLKGVTTTIEQVFVQEQRTYCDFLKDCIALRKGDTWVKTAFDKAVNVRARKTVPCKSKMERRIQEDVLAWFASRLTSAASGYGRQLNLALQKHAVFRNGVGIMNFGAATLATLHTSFEDADWTRFQIVRTTVQVSSRGENMGLRNAISLHFRHNRSNGRLEYVKDPSLLDLSMCGLSYVMESKVRPGQQGEGICAEDDEEWLSFLTAHPAALLLIYAFSHPAFPSLCGKTELESADRKSHGRSNAHSLPPATALSLLDSFDMRRTAANPDLNELAAAAAVFGKQYGLGASKYIETIRDGIAYREPAESVALNIHHIYAGTGLDADRRTCLCNQRLHSTPTVPMTLLVAGSWAVPCSNKRYVKMVLEADDDHFIIKSESIIAETGVNVSIFPQDEQNFG